MRFELEAECRDTGARAGRIYTEHGVIETPVFMPVGTQATVKGVMQSDLAGELDAKIILANTYHLFLRPGHEVIRELGGLHRFMSWPRAILTDSGGFQVFSLSDLRKISEDGVLFRSHLDGDAHMFTPESTVDVQLALGSDIMMPLDECLEYPARHEAANQAMRRTVRWARSAYRHFERRVQETGPGSALFPIVQGSMFADLRRDCATELLDLNAPGYAIGGLSVGEPRSLSLEMTEATTPLLPRDRPRYVMGVGMPEDTGRVRRPRRRHDGLRAAIPQRQERLPVYGFWTSHYQASPVQERFGSGGREMRLHHLPHLLPRLSPPPVPGRRDAILHRLATLHNLKYYLDMMRQMRQAIVLGRFRDFLYSVRQSAVESS